jgi:hypothetical protein
MAERSLTAPQDGKLITLVNKTLESKMARPLRNLILEYAQTSYEELVKRMAMLHFHDKQGDAGVLCNLTELVFCPHPTPEPISIPEGLYGGSLERWTAICVAVVPWFTANLERALSETAPIQSLLLKHLGHAHRVTSYRCYINKRFHYSDIFYVDDVTRIAPLDAGDLTLSNAVCDVDVLRATVTMRL